MNFLAEVLNLYRHSRSISIEAQVVSLPPASLSQARRWTIQQRWRLRVPGKEGNYTSQESITPGERIVFSLSFCQGPRCLYVLYYHHISLEVVSVDLCLGRTQNGHQTKYPRISSSASPIFFPVRISDACGLSTTSSLLSWQALCSSPWWSHLGQICTRSCRMSLSQGLKEVVVPYPCLAGPLKIMATVSANLELALRWMKVRPILA